MAVINIARFAAIDNNIRGYLFFNLLWFWSLFLLLWLDTFKSHSDRFRFRFNGAATTMAITATTCRLSDVKFFNRFGLQVDVARHC